MAKLVGISIIFIAVLLGFVFDKQADAQSWVTSPDLRFTRIENPSHSFMFPTALMGAGNRYCNHTSIIKNDILTYENIFEKEAKESRCVVETLLGATDGQVLVRDGSGKGGPLQLRGSKEYLLAGNNLSHGITYDLAGAPAGSGYLSYSKELFNNIETLYSGNGTVSHNIRGDGGLKNLQNNFNQPLTIRLSTAAYSNNAKWLVFDSPFYGLVRLNAETGELLSFGTPTTYNQGYDPSYSLTISSNGRFVAISTVNRFDIYDMDTCVNQTGRNAHLKNCQVKNLEETRKARTGFGYAATKLRFLTDDTLVYYTDDIMPGGVIEKRLYRLTLGDIPEFRMDYLGLGDSYSSGEGAYSYKSNTDTPENMCHVSLFSYPFLVGSEANKERYNSVACSGAVTGDVNNDPKIYSGQSFDGLKEEDRFADPIVDSFVPGKLTQYTFTSKAKPEAVTISIGGNNVGFGDKLTKCITLHKVSDTCFNTFKSRAEIYIEIKYLVADLKTTFEKLKEGNRRVYALGYPKIVAPGGNCAANVQLNNSEIDFANKMTELLNEAVEVAAKQAGVVYVDVENIFEGRRLCETSSQNTLIHGLTTGNDSGLWFVRFIAKESFHPKREGHQFYKQAVIAQTNNLTKPMPIADASAELRTPSASDPFWMVEKTNVSLYRPVFLNMLDSMTRGQVIKTSLTRMSRPIMFKPNSAVNIFLYSEPQLIGTATASTNGQVEIDVTIPGNIEPGYHSIHILGTSIDGQPIDVYDYFFIAASETDFDGDGILNEDEGCVLVAPVGQDDDRDGIDNACDDVLDPLPEPEPEPEPEPLPAEEEEPPVIPLPSIGTSPNSQEKTIGNNETVAGNEELALQNENNTTLTQNPVNAVNVNTTPATNQTVRLAVATNEVNATAEPEILGSQTSQFAQTDQPITTPSSKPDDKNPPIQAVKNPDVYKYYLIGGAVGFLLLIGIILYARRQ